MDLNEYVRTYTLNYEHQLFATNKDVENLQWATIKGGFYLENKDRIFSSRNLGYAIANFMNFDYTMIYQPYDQILNNANINSTTGLTLDEDTRGADKYIAQNDLLATYLMTNIPYKNWNITAGVRREDNRQSLQSADITGNPIEANIDSVVYLPSLNVSYNLSKKTLLRFAYGKTINRPEFREMAPFSFYDFDNNFIISGNPNIQFSTIKNIDLRWEHYPSTNEVVSAALFYKQFENPIEQYFVPGVGSGGTRSFMPGNALAATSYGAEIDVRKSMGEWINKPFAKNLVVVANGSYIVSNIELSAASIETGLNPNRPMVGQSPYIVNTGLYYDNDSTGWQVSALYNVIGPRIAIVGIPGVPEAYEMPRNVIDLTVAKNFDNGLGVRFGIQDLLNATSFMIQDANGDGKLNVDNDQVIQRFNRGTYFTMGIQYKFRKK
jgi:TonB-dependent receptor